MSEDIIEPLTQQLRIEKRAKQLSREILERTRVEVEEVKE